MPKERTQRSFVEEVPRLLEQTGLTLRALADSADVDIAFLSRVLRQRDYKSPSPALCTRVARAFGKPDDYFPEYRAKAVIDRVRSDGDLRDRLYEELIAR